MCRKLLPTVLCVCMLLAACASAGTPGVNTSGAPTESPSALTQTVPTPTPVTPTPTPTTPEPTPMPVTPTPTTPTPTPTPVTPTPTTPTPTTPEEPFEPFTLAFTGDISFADTYYKKADRLSSGIVGRANLRGRQLIDCIDKSLLEEMRRVDLLVVNCESSVSERGTPLGLKGKEYSFRTSYKNSEMFKTIGADLIGLANNHTYDFGPEAFLDTLDRFAELGIPTVGAGRNIEEAYAPYYYEKSGVRVAIIATSRAEKNYFTLVAEENVPGICGCYDETLVLEAIRTAKQNADYVIVFPHFGYENTTEIETAQYNACRHFIDAGADLIVGGHAHCLQGIDTYKGKVIFYNLGNYLFNAKTLPTALLEVHFESRDNVVLQILPCRQYDGRVEDQRGTENGAETLQMLRKLSPGIAIDRSGCVTVALVS